MLIEFKVKNFRSFRDEIVFSMVAGPDKSLPDHTTTIPTFGNRRLLHSAVIYGPNASGKSTLMKAIEFVDNLVNENRKLEELDLKPFLLNNESPNAPCEFEITYLDSENVRYQYGFHVTTERIVREWLIAYPKGSPRIWFEREYLKQENDPKWHLGKHSTSWHFTPNLKGRNRQIEEVTRQDVLFLSNAVKFDHQQLEKALKWFRQGLHIIDINQRNELFSFYSAVKAKGDERLRDRISHLLEIADFGISGLDIQEKIYTEQDLPQELQSKLLGKKGLNIYMLHPGQSSNEIRFPIKEESFGTQRFFALSRPLLEALENGRTLFVDELDASLHPKLLRHLIELFHNPQTNPKGAQLIFNTHDTTLLDGSLFRRDQIWFMEKDREGCSHLYSLLDFSPRQGEALAKGYLIGRYGAIPFLSDEQWMELNHEKA